MEGCIKVTVNNVIDGDELELLVKKDGTLLDVKELFAKEEGIEPARQRFFCGPVELEDDDFPLAGLLDLNNNTLDVVLPEASDPEVEAEADHDVWIVLGASRHNFEKIQLKKNDPETRTLTKGKLGIVTQLPNVDAEGRNVYTVDRYKFREEEEQIKIKLKVEDGRTVVKKMVDDQEVLLPVQKSVEYKLMTRYERGVERTLPVAQILGNIGSFFEGVARFAEFVQDFI